jgi:hypothetical protein
MHDSLLYGECLSYKISNVQPRQCYCTFISAGNDGDHYSDIYISHRSLHPPSLVYLPQTGKSPPWHISGPWGNYSAGGLLFCRTCTIPPPLHSVFIFPALELAQTEQSTYIGTTPSLEPFLESMLHPVH